MSNTIYTDVDLKKYSWFNLGGLAKNFFKPKSIYELSNFLSTNKLIEKDIHILGAGSKVIIPTFNLNFFL